MTLRTLLCTAALLLSLAGSAAEKIDRRAVVRRNNPSVRAIDTLASFTVGNGDFAFTADVTGLQTFAGLYKRGMALGTQSHWGWHSFGNPDSLRFDETVGEFDFGRGHKESYAIQHKAGGRGRQATNWYRENPHRLHLGCVGFDGLAPDRVAAIDQTLDLWTGTLRSHFTVDGVPTDVETLCSPDADRIAVKVATTARTPVALRFPYPTGQPADDASRWDADVKHATVILENRDHHALLKRVLDTTVYYVCVRWEGDARFEQRGRNETVLTPEQDAWSFSVEFAQRHTSPTAVAFADDAAASARHWEEYWQQGGFVDFGRCTDPRAAELERRVILSQYLLALNSAGVYPPQETGLTYNSWYGRPHLEMVWWHQAHFALWNREQIAARTLGWYLTVQPIARQIAERQGFEGVRWMKMTDPWGGEAPSNTGSFLIWQQPHPIYMAELIYRADPSEAFLRKYADMVEQTARFMADFLTYDAENDRYIIKGAIPAQETLRAAVTINPPFELAYWYYALDVAQQWRERLGLPRHAEWDTMLHKLSPLTADEQGRYLAAENAVETYSDIRFTSDHMACLMACGMLPLSPLVDPDRMRKTFDWVYDNWNWEKTWGWDYPTTAMNAVRMGEPEKALRALLMDKRTNTYLTNGHNYQTERLRCYLPGNGGLLAAVALMCAGWDGCEVANPGFPQDGTWDVRWEAINPMP